MHHSYLGVAGGTGPSTPAPATLTTTPSTVSNGRTAWVGTERSGARNRHAGSLWRAASRLLRGVVRMPPIPSGPRGAASFSASVTRVVASSPARTDTQAAIAGGVPPSGGRIGEPGVRPGGPSRATPIHVNGVGLALKLTPDRPVCSTSPSQGEATRGAVAGAPVSALPTRRTTEITFIPRTCGGLTETAAV